MTPSGPEAWKRAWDLLEQAFEPYPLGSDPSLPDRYIAAAQAYAMLANAAANAAPSNTHTDPNGVMEQYINWQNLNPITGWSENPEV